jgi:diaminopimelate decarboxylase/aspartate kinase
MNQSNYYIVLKFGGTSQKETTYQMILNRIKETNKYTEQKIKYVIVLSAMSGITNKLLQYEDNKDPYILNQIINSNMELANKSNVNIEDICEKFKEQANNLIEIDDVVSFIAQGEFLTCRILNRYLKSNGIKSKFISSLDVIESNQENNSFYNKGEFKVNPDKILENLITNDVVVIPGFSARTPSNKFCLLGRGGSDTSGSIIAASINAKVYEIWTDVNGIYSSDPRKISNTFINELVNYEAAQEVAAMGAKVIHPYCILPCAQKNIPIHIKNTFEPDSLSTIIFNNPSSDVYGVTIQDNVKVFKITSLNMWNNYGFVYDIFSIFKQYNVDVNIINTSQFNITTTTDEINEGKLWSVCEELRKKYQVELNFGNSIVSVVGDNIRITDSIGNIFKLTKKFDIITTSYSSNDMSLSFVIKSSDAIKLAQNLHDIIFENKVERKDHIKKLSNNLEKTDI